MQPWSLSFGVAALLACGAPALADSPRCQSINGNRDCAGSRAVICQTVNGRTVCSSPSGDVVQSFGSGAPLADRADAAQDEAPEGADSAPLQRIERHGPGGHTLLFSRDGSTLHLRTDRLRIDRD